MREFIVTFKHIALASAFCAAGVAAQATVVVSTAGPVTTYTENFDGGTSFSAEWFDSQFSGDDYLYLKGSSMTSSFTFTTAVPLAALQLDFWYQVPANGQAEVSFGPSGNVALLDTPGNAAQFLLYNPGPASPAASSFSGTLTNLAAGSYTITFATTAGVLRALKVDDVVITATAVPEPSGYLLMAAGLGLVGWLARRRSRV